MTKSWQTYEDVARHLLASVADEFGLSDVEGKQSVDGLKSGTQWELDAKGVEIGSDQFVIIECRRYTTSRLSQEDLGGLAWRIIDTGARGGITVSPLPLQEGAQRVAAANRVVHVQLNADATPTEFQMRFLDKIRLGFKDEVSVRMTEHLTIRVFKDGELEQVIEVSDPADTSSRRP